VGAGISGLSLARHLQERGYYVELFEKDSCVGGKIETFRYRDELMVEMCPLLFTSRSESLINLINEYGLHTTIFNQTDRIGFDSFTGAMRTIEVPPEKKVQLAQAVKKYIQYQMEYEQLQSLELPCLNANSDLFVTMADWL